MALPRSPQVQIVQIEGDRATYSAAIELAAASIPATPTDLFKLSGDGTKIVRLSKFEVYADANAAGTYSFFMIRRTELNTGGVFSAITPAKHDIQNPTPTATFGNYTTSPTVLGAGDIFRSASVALPVAGTTGYPFFPLIWLFGQSNAQMPSLRSGISSFVLNLAGQAVPAGLELWVSIEWTEDVV
jgi:hypothetical protein